MVVGLGAWGGWLVHRGPRWPELTPFARALAALVLCACLTVAVVAPWYLLGPDTATDTARLLGDRPLLAMSVRNLGVLAAVGLLLHTNRQGWAQLGLLRRGLRSEALFGVAALGGAFVAHLVVGMALAVVVTAFSPEALQTEARQRAGTVVEIVSSTSVPALVVVVVTAAAFEEVVFRGFVLPRARQALHRWATALVLVAILFGIGHLYEGTLAVVQTAALGIYFGLILILRGRLLPAIIAHAGFNGVMVGLALWLRDSGMLDGADSLLRP